jgi:hypothetical protein
MIGALLLALLGCSSAPPEAPEPVETEPERYEHYIRYPTEIVGDRAVVILPEFYGPDLSVAGMGAGWVEEEGKRSIEVSGDCLLTLFGLTIRCRVLSATLVPVAEEPEVLIQASGDVSLAHQVKGVGSWFEHLRLLTIRNERMRMMEE